VRLRSGSLAHRVISQHIGQLKLRRRKQRPSAAAVSQQQQAAALMEEERAAAASTALAMAGGDGVGKGRSLAAIFKVHDDCRQDTMTVQIIQLLKDCFHRIGLRLKLFPYSVIPNRTGPEKSIGGMIQVVPGCKSRDGIGKAGAKDLLQYFRNQFGSEDSQTFATARRNFASSLAGYSVVCYLLWVKDRHNGNVLIDAEGHLVHIDFGFLLGISPGGNLGFETAAFKLSREMVDVLGGPASEAYKLFEQMSIRAFLAARQVMEPVCALISSMADSGLPCFMHRTDNLDKLRARFAPQLTETQAAKFWRDKIADAQAKLTTVYYDGIQKLQNDINSAEWR